MIDYEQGSLEWLRERAGKINASEMADVLAMGEGVFKSGPRKGQKRPDGKARADLINKIASEIVTGEPAPVVTAKAMTWGKDVENAARQAYSAQTGEIVDQVVTFTHPRYPFIRCSPDGVIRPDGGIQIKCPITPREHMSAWRDGMPDDHIEQVQAEIWIQGLNWLDFVSYHPTYPEHLRLYVQRIEPDKEFAAKMETACLSLWAEVQNLIGRLPK